MIEPTFDENGFPIYEDIEPLPARLTEKERLTLAFRLMADHGERVGDYLMAAVNEAMRQRPVEDMALVERWMAMSDLMASIQGSPITLTYRYCDRLAAERDDEAEHDARRGH